MEPLDTARLRIAIERRLDELRSAITERLGDAALVNDALDRNADSGDLSVAADRTTTDFADAHREIEAYQAGRLAHARLLTGDYRTCADCGEEIPLQRQQAQPFAIRCVACETRRERGAGTHPTTM